MNHWTLLGDLFYSTVLFGGFALVYKQAPVRNEAQPLATASR